MLFYLMHKESKVLSFDVSVDANLFSGLKVLEIYNKNKLPICFYKKEKLAKEKLYSWIISRYFDSKRKDFFELTNYLNNSYTNRNFACIYFCSLYTYGVSVADNYWLNPQKQYKVGSMFESNPFQFIITPKTYEEIIKIKLNFSDNISNIMLHIFFKNFEKIKSIEYKNISLNSLNFTTYGNRLKIWKNKNATLCCEKFYEKNEQKKIEEIISISTYIKENKIETFILWEYETAQSIVSKCFLKENEEYIDLSQLFLCKVPNILNDKKIYTIAKKFGLKKKDWKQYIQERNALKKEFSIPDYCFLDNLGFIIDTNTRKVVKIINRI